MDWKRVKTILIALLLVTNLILGYSVYGQYRSLSRTESRALEQALALAGEESGLTADMVGALPRELSGWTVARDSAAEDDFARGLLGAEGFAIENAGGGIFQYTGRRGRGEIKNGGEMEFSLRGAWDAGNPAAAFATLLREAGLEVSEADVAPDGDGSAVCAQTWQGLPLDRYQLSCRFEGEAAYVTGRWLLCREPVADSAAPSEAERVLYLAQWLKGSGRGPVQGLSAGYQAIEGRVQPVWFVSLSGAQGVYDLSGRTVTLR